MSACLACTDNFIVNNKCVQCKYCQGLFHLQCVRLKDSIQKSIIDSTNLLWFCNTCLPIVMDKLSTRIVGSPPTGAGTPSSNHAALDGQSSFPNIENLVTTVVNKKLDELYNESLVMKHDFGTQLSQLRRDFCVLRDSNVDLVRLLTSKNPPSQSCFMDRELSDIGSDVEGDNRDVGSAMHTDAGPATSCVAANPVGKTISDGGHRGNRRGARSRGLSRDRPSVRPSAVSPPVGGLGASSDLLKPAPKGREWIWVGNLSRDTAVENVADYLKLHVSGKDILVFDLKSKGYKKSFKVGSRDLSLDELLSPSLWPPEVLIRPFRSAE